LEQKISRLGQQYVFYDYFDAQALQKGHLEKWCKNMIF
jgi:hypothetical protein